MATIPEPLQPHAGLADQPPAATQALEAPNATPVTEGLTASNRNSIITTLLIAVGLAVVATISARQVSATPTSTWVLWLAVAVGGLGGLAHEIAQSGGKILFFERRLDGFYIGSLGGVILGAVAGLLAARGFIVNPSTVAAGAQPGPLPLIFEMFFAGLALKGITEAAGGQAVASIPQVAQASTSLTNVAPVSPLPNIGH
jgi:hypothetical protein